MCHIRIFVIPIFTELDGTAKCTKYEERRTKSEMRNKLFRTPGWIKWFHLPTDVPDVVGDSVVAMLLAFMIVKDQAEGDDQLNFAVLIGGNGVVVAFEPANGLLFPPGNLRVVPVHGEFSAAVSVNVVHIRTAMTFILHSPEMISTEFYRPGVI